MQHGLRNAVGRQCAGVGDPGRTVTAAEVRAFAKDRLGSVKAPKQVEVWPDLPRSRVGKVLKTDIKATLRSEPDRR